MGYTGKLNSCSCSSSSSLALSSSSSTSYSSYSSFLDSHQLPSSSIKVGFAACSVAESMFVTVAGSEGSTADS